MQEELAAGTALALHLGDATWRMRMAPVNDQITAMEWCERAVDSVFARMQPPCLLDACLSDEAHEQFDLQADSLSTWRRLLRAA